MTRSSTSAIEASEWTPESWGITTCLICDILDNEPWVPFRTMFSYEEVETESIFASNTFQIIADIGPIREGHCLVNTNRHISSLGRLSRQEIDELVLVKNKLRRAIKREYMSPIFFEHGALNHVHSGGCCIDHAHLHAVPTDVDILFEISHDFEFQRIYSHSDIIEFAHNREYLFYENQSEQMFLATVSRVPTQYFRRILSRIHHNETPWNWRDHVRFSGPLNTKDKIKSVHQHLMPHLRE